MIRKLVNFVVYGHFWIAACAAAMVCQSELLWKGAISADAYTGFVFFGTLALYGLHRILGLQKIKGLLKKGRLLIVAKAKWTILINTAAGGILASWFFLKLPLAIKWSLLLPLALSLAYVVPLFPGKRRLRDFHFIKIFLIALVWAYLTVWIPCLLHGRPAGSAPVWQFLERVFFIFAITVPFDIRDLTIDQFTRVKTIPAIWGSRRAIHLALTALTMGLGMVVINWKAGFYSTSECAAMALSFAVTGGLIVQSKENKDDLFYSGWMDGTMVFQFLLILLSRAW